jgi:hypothetical protein
MFYFSLNNQVFGVLNMNIAFNIFNNHQILFNSDEVLAFLAESNNVRASKIKN